MINAYGEPDSPDTSNQTRGMNGWMEFEDRGVDKLTHTLGKNIVSFATGVSFLRRHAQRGLIPVNAISWTCATLGKWGWIDNNNTGTRDRDDKEQGENDDFTENHENDIFQPEEADNSLHTQETEYGLDSTARFLLVDQSRHVRVPFTWDMLIILLMGCHIGISLGNTENEETEIDGIFWNCRGMGDLNDFLAEVAGVIAGNRNGGTTFYLGKRGWAKNSQQLSELINDLDKKAEFTCLSPNELNTKAFANDRLAKNEILTANFTMDEVKMAFSGKAFIKILYRFTA
ncbi:hypothetical protein ACJX0J_010798 [Zea mays]